MVPVQLHLTFLYRTGICASIGLTQSKLIGCTTLYDAVLVVVHFSIVCYATTVDAQFFSEDIHKYKHLPILLQEPDITF
jgi:hypothetical protein